VSDTILDRAKKSICIVCATPLTIHLFLRIHVERLSENYNITILHDGDLDSYVDISDLPAEIVNFPIQRKISLISDVFSIFRLFSYFLTRRFDLVWSVAPKAGLLANLVAYTARVPLRLFVFQGEVWASKRGLMRNVLKLCDWVVSKTATHLLAVSEGERKFLINEGIVSISNISVLGSGSICGVDCLKFKPNSATRQVMRAGLGISDTSSVCVFLGRIKRDKGVFDLVQAFLKARRHGFDRLCLLFVGPDEECLEAELKDLAGPHARDLHFVAFTKTPQNYLVASDIFCLPSYREGFPISVLEAGASGLPIFGTRIYGVSDAVIDGVTGKLFEAGDVDGLSELIMDSLIRPELYKAMGNEARAWIMRDFDCAKVVERYVSFVEKILR
jgi:glycosyltransferase involved in cell wall biosynthesis